MVSNCIELLLSTKEIVCVTFIYTATFAAVATTTKKKER